MADLEKVLHGLDSCSTDCGVPNICGLTECPYMGNGPACVHMLANDALALLIAQQPHVMTLEEIWDRGDDEPLFLEYTLPTKSVLRPAIFQPDNSDDGGGDGYMCVVSAWCASGFYNRKEYGKTWRCWTSRPDEKTRSETPWAT